MALQEIVRAVLAFGVVIPSVRMRVLELLVAPFARLGGQSRPTADPAAKLLEVGDLEVRLELLEAAARRPAPADDPFED